MIKLGLQTQYKNKTLNCHVKLISRTENWSSATQHSMLPSSLQAHAWIHTHSNLQKPHKTSNLKDYLLCVRLWSAGRSGREFSGRWWWSQQEERQRSSQWNQLCSLQQLKKQLWTTHHVWNQETRYKGAMFIIEWHQWHWKEDMGMGEGFVYSLTRVAARCKVPCWLTLTRDFTE